MTRGLVTVLLAALLVALAAGSATARRYRWVSPDGAVTYSDQPPRDPGTVYEADGVTVRVPSQDEALPPPRPSEPVSERGDVGASPAPPPPASQRGDVGTGPTTPPSGSARADPEPSHATPRREREAVTALLAALHLPRDGQRLARTAHDVAMRAAWREPARAADWVAAAARVSPERLARLAEAEAGRRLGVEPVAMVVDWLTSPAGRRVVEALTEPTTPRMEVDLRLFVTRLPETPPPAGRVATVRRFLRAVGFGALAFEGADLVEARLRALVDSARSDRVAPERDGPAAEMARHGRMVVALFRCRSLSDLELRRAAEFWESPAARAVATVYRQSIAAAVVALTEPRAAR